MATIDITNWDTKKNIEVDSNTTSPGSGKVQPVILDGSLSEGTTGNGSIGYNTSDIDTTNTSTKLQSIVFTDSDESTTKDYEVENPEDLGTTTDVTVWVYDSGWTADGTVQLVLGTGTGDGSDYSVDGVGNNPWSNGQNVRAVYHDPSEATDSGPNSYNLTSTTDSGARTGQFADGGDYDGADDESLLPEAATSYQSNTDQDFTIVCWFNADSTTNSFYSFRDGTDIHAQLESPGITLGVYDGSTNKAEYSTTVSGGTWYQTVGVYDAGSNNLDLFVDSQSGSSASPSNPINQDGTSAIGSRPIGGTFFDGIVDELRLYEDTKNSDWIQADYDASPKAGQVFFSQQAAEDAVQIQPKTPVTQDGFEDGDFTNSPVWSDTSTTVNSTTVEVQTGTVLNGTYSARLFAQGNGDLAQLELDRGQNTGISDGDVFQTSVQGSGGSSYNISYYLREEGGGYIQMKLDGSSGEIQAFSSNGSTTNTVVNSFSESTEYLFEIEFDTVSGDAIFRAFDSSDTFLGEATIALPSGLASNLDLITLEADNNESADLNSYFDDISYKSQQLLNIVTGQANGNASFTGNATATNKIFAQASGTGTLNGNATATQKIIARAQANGSASLTGSADAYKRISVTANGSGSLNGDAQASFGNLVNARASGSASFTGTATGTKTIQPSANGSASLTGDVSGSIKISIVAEGEASFNGSAEGTAVRIINAEASGSASLTGTAISTIPKVFRDTTLELDIDKSQSKTLSGDIDK